MKWLIYVIFTILGLLITFFGLGPVLFADGSNAERFTTLAIVLVLYVILIVILRVLIKKIKK